MCGTAQKSGLKYEDNNNNNENKVVGQYTLTGSQLHQHPSEPLLLAVERMGKPSHEIVG